MPTTDDATGTTDSQEEVSTHDPAPDAVSDETGEQRNSPSGDTSSLPLVPEDATAGPELVIGLVTPIGTDTAELASRLCGHLSDYNYKGIVIKLSDHLPEPSKRLGESEASRVRRLIAAGDDFCNAHTSRARPDGDPAALARLAVREILRARVALHRQSGEDEAAEKLVARPHPRTAYILHSLKRPAEVQLLREIYGEQFILLASQGTLTERIEALMARPLGTSDEFEKRAIVDGLIELDRKEEDKHGQRVNETYPEADYFLRDTDTNRFVRLLFREPIAPDIGEYAMYVAHASRARSLAASRKVGASIVVNDAVISTGYNDAPYGQTPDVIAGTDTSEVLKQDNVRDTMLRLRKAGLLEGGPDVPIGDNLLNRAISALKGGELLSVIEYQRAVHAEARAIDDATVRGVSPEGGTLYVTTFPCHLCYKHALSVRLDRVQYIEPYSKSRATMMYPDGADDRLLPYAGVAPLRYLPFFDDRPAFEADPTGSFPEVDRHGGLPMVKRVRNDVDVHGQERLAVNGLLKEHQ